MPDFKHGDLIYVITVFNPFGNHPPIARKKCGVFSSRIKHTRKWNGPDMAYVKFDGNATYSKVRLDRIRKA